MTKPMMRTGERVRGTHALSALRFGQQALFKIEGLRTRMVHGILINYAVFFGAAIAMNGVFYFYVLEPFIDWVFGGDEGLWATAGTVMLWLIQLTAASVFILIALRFSIQFLSLWNQSLIFRVIQNFREVKEPPFSLKVLWSGMLGALYEGLKACVIPLLLLFLGLIPLLGVVLVFLIESHLLGRDMIRVYLDCLDRSEDVVTLRKTWRWVPMRLGWLPMGLAFVPLLGWLLLPLVLTYEVIGFAYYVESSRQSE